MICKAKILACHAWMLHWAWSLHALSLHTLWSGWNAISEQSCQNQVMTNMLQSATQSISEPIVCHITKYTAVQAGMKDNQIWLEDRELLKIDCMTCRSWLDQFLLACVRAHKWCCGQNCRNPCLCKPIRHQATPLCTQLRYGRQAQKLLSSIVFFLMISFPRRSTL